MARIAGYSGVVTFDTHPYAGVTEWTLDIEDDMPDATGMDSAGWKEYIPGLKGWNATVALKYDDDDEAYFESGDDMNVGKEAVLILLTATGELSYTGTAIVKRVTPTVRVDGEVEFTIQLTGTGALTYPSTA